MRTDAIIRMYNQNDVGDCFLLSFSTDSKTVYYLIDFGSISGGNENREAEIASNITSIVKDQPLTIILTHQHKDHYSGFLSSGDILKGDVRKLWLSYLDDEHSTEGNTIRSATEGYWKKSKKIKELVDQKFPSLAADHPVKKMMNEKKELDLFAEEQSGGKAITKLLEICHEDVQFLTPGKSFPLPDIDGVNVYVLGPPFDKTLLTKLNPNKDEAVRGLNSMMELANMDISGTLMLNALEEIGSTDIDQSDFPFNKRYVDNSADNPYLGYYNESEKRKIEHEWLGEIGRLALYMDRLTNNTSLVLAFELIESKKILLFVGDAQIGNWLSWFNLKFEGTNTTSDDLLSRTVFYKAGHHSSLNATLKKGLDLMDEKQLVIMIPVNDVVSNQKHFAMLRPEVLRGFHRKSKGRVLRSDTVIQPDITTGGTLQFAKAQVYGDNLTVGKASDGGHLYLDLTVQDTRV